MRPQNTIGFRGSAEKRFWAKVVIAANGCWLWTGALTDGYGYFWPGGSRMAKRMVKAHRWAYEKYVGPIPAGLEPDHVCRTRRCVNPLHLEPVTSQINTLLGIGPAAINAQKFVCKFGHRNWKIRKDGTGRECLTCQQIRNAHRNRAKTKGS